MHVAEPQALAVLIACVPSKIVEPQDISALGLLHAGYGVPEELISPFAAGTRQQVGFGYAAVRG